MSNALQSFKDSVVRFWNEKVHFIQIHYLYILTLIFVTSGLYYCQPGTEWPYIDGLFMATTIVTNTGLNTIEMSKFSTYQMVVMYFAMILGNHVFISFIVVIVRKHYFSKRFEDILLFNKERYMREMHRRRQVNKNDIELGLKRTPTISSAISQIASPVRRRRLSFSSTMSTPVEGAMTKSKRRNSLIERMTNANEVYSLLTHFRDRQRDLLNRHPRPHHHPTSPVASPEQAQFDKELPNAIHPTDCESSTVGSPSTMPDVGSPSSDTAGFSSDATQTASATQGIAFAENIEQQRESARRRLEKERRLDELLQSIREKTPEVSATHWQDDDDDDDEDSDDILRQPIDKSQLTKKQRYRIGGTEYRALDMLAHIVPLYYIGFVVISSFLLRAYVAASSYAAEVLRTSNTNGPVDPWFFSFFLGLSGFNNLGLLHLDASLVPFQNAPFPLIVCIVLILVGNTAYAITLRFIIWSLYKLTPRNQTMRRETFRFLLDHPRRCYTTLFPATQTWWVLIILIAITIMELVCFLAFNYWLPVVADLPWGSRVLDGLFQSVATRNAGFTVINLSEINPGTQLVYIVAMYISVYPVAISMRNSNVYQERALGIYATEEAEPQFSDQDLGGTPFLKLRRHATINSVVTTSRKVLRGPDFFVLTQIQRQLTSDICWVIVGIFCILVLEAGNIMSPSPVTTATVIYECVSAFGNVGASTGYPNTSTSQAAQYRTLSKLVLIFLMYRGRHRGLPSAIDLAVLLPSEQLDKREAEDQMFKRRNTSMQVAGAPHLFYTRSSTL